MLKAALEAAMTTVPRLLMADWMMMFDSEKMAVWMPAGRPMLMILLNAVRSMRSSRSSTRTRSPCSRRRSSSTELTAFESTVAMATPLTFILSTMTKNRLRITFRIPETVSAASGIFVSPMLRKMAASKL